MRKLTCFVLAELGTGASASVPDFQVLFFKHTHMHKDSLSLTQRYTHIVTHAQTHVRTRTHKVSHTYRDIHTESHTHVRAHARTHIETHIQRQTHTVSHVHTHRLTCTHVWSGSGLCLLPWLTHWQTVVSLPQVFQ